MKLNEEYINQNVVDYPYQGQIEVSIDFSGQVHNFRGHKALGRTIYSCDDYKIYSRHESLNNDSFFTAKDITVYSMKSGREALLEDYAFSWITDPSRDIDDFKARDFLEQTCITHSIWRCREDADSFAPYNEYLEEKHAKDMRVTNALIAMLEPKIKYTIKVFNKRYPCIDILDVESQARQFSSILLIGENKKHIEKTRDFVLKNANKKLEAKKNFRESSVHVLKHNKNKVRDELDWQTVNDGVISTILESHTKVDDISFLLKMMEPDAMAMFQAQSLNYNSDLIYKPWLKDTAVEHIFGRVGRKSLIFKLLKDYFKAKINNKSDLVDINNLSEDANFTDFSFVLPRRWKKNQNRYPESDKLLYLEKAKSILTLKCFEAYKKWLSGEYNSVNVNERQSLSRAKRIIKKSDLNIPV